MRLAVALALMGALPALATSVNPDKPVPVDHLPTPIAEPAEATAYAPPVVYLENSTASTADSGPAQKYFVIASGLDSRADQASPRISSELPGEKIALDKSFRVPLVHDVQDDSTYRGGQNDSLLYEIKYLNWGAITHAQLRAREGHYFTITYVNHGPPEDLVTRFEYRQVKSLATVRTLEQEKKHHSGAARAYFAVLGKAYLTYGPVSAWRFTVLRGNTVVAEAKSFLW